MIENLQDKLYQLENKQPKFVQICSNIIWEAKNDEKLFLKYLKDRICKIKEYLITQL